MIKEYFTDGLIGLAILLSLFRTDLIGLNFNLDNLINYPEVQDIIQGQTVMYSPANFHSTNSIHALRHPKLRDRETLSVLYRNIINNFNTSHFHFHPSNLHQIEAFLVSGSQPTAIDPSFVNINDTTHNNSQQTTLNNINALQTSVNAGDDIPENSSLSQVLPQESANSFTESETIIVDIAGVNDNASTTSSQVDQPLSVDVSFLFNVSPFPGCNLTTEDLNLIELLWKQDVDLGVGKEVYDHSLREELEKQKEQEYFKTQEKIKAQVAAREKEEKNKQEEASRWLNQNYSRDGETGEWVKRQNKAATKGTSSASGSTTVDENDDFLTLEAALDYICTRVDSDEFQSDLDGVVPVANSFANNLTAFDSPTELQPLLPAQNAQQSLCLENLPQSSLNMENEWDQVENYLNVSLNAPPMTEAPPMAAAVLDEALSVSAQDFDLDVKAEMLSPLDSGVDDGIFTSANLPLIQDVSLSSSDMEPVPELGPVTLTNSSMPPQPCAMNTSLDWEAGNMTTIFGNLSALQQDNIDDIDLENMDDLFNTMTEANDLLGNVTSPDVDSLVLSTTHNDTVNSLPSTSFSEQLADTFDGLEGATGGADYSGPTDGLDAPYRKISRLSESGSDSGFSGKGAFSSSSSSASSSYTGSPTDSSMGYQNNLTNSNDTDHDPHGTKVFAHQVAHNHTYNTLPGHVPREVKKYAPKQHSKKGPQCRDEKKANELKIPMSVDEIVESPVETFNDLLTKYSLSEEQLTLIRDIRRRGKNKLAAQNCRKRKVGAIVNLSDEMVDLQKARDRLVEERAEMERESRRMREKFGHLYTHIFESLRDEHGQPYDPSLYSLQQSSDGNVFLVPRNVTTTTSSTTDINGNGSTNGTGSVERNGRIKKRRSDN